MTRHLNLLASLPREAPRAKGLPVLAVPALAAALLLASGAVGWWSQQTTAELESRLQAARRTTTAPSTTGAMRLDPTVLQALRQDVLAQEAQAALLAGAGSDAPADAPPSRWLAALDETGASGLALDTVRVEPGARLSIEGSARQAADVNAFIARLQRHPVTGQAAIGRLEIRRGEGDGAPLRFRLTPTAPESPAADTRAAAPEGKRGGP